MQEFGKLLIKAHELCEKADIRYEDYIDRILCLPRNSAKDLCKVASVEVNPATPIFISAEGFFVTDKSNKIITLNPSDLTKKM